MVINNNQSKLQINGNIVELFIPTMWRGSVWHERETEG